MMIFLLSLSICFLFIPSCVAAPSGNANENANKNKDDDETTTSTTEAVTTTTTAAETTTTTAAETTTTTAAETTTTTAADTTTTTAAETTTTTAAETTTTTTAAETTTAAAAETTTTAAADTTTTTATTTVTDTTATETTTVKEIVLVSSSEQVNAFYDDTVDNTDKYNSQVFPRINQTDTISVDMKFSLISVKDFDEVAGTLALTGKLNIRWRDDVLALTYSASTHGNFTHLLFSTSKVWLPTVTVFNSVSKIKQVGEISNRVKYTRVTRDMDWVPGVETKTGCNVDAANFPFDVQRCKVTFALWGYKIDEVKFDISYPEIDMALFKDNEQWEVTETIATVKTIAGSSYLNYELVLARRSLYFLANLLFPILVLSVLNAIVFLLPPATGERISYSVTAFLSFAVYLTLTAETLPRVSEPMAIISVYLMMMVVVSAGTALFTIFTLRIYHKEDDEKVPDNIAFLVACLNCKVCKDEDDDDDDMNLFVEETPEETKAPLEVSDEPLSDAATEKEEEAGLAPPKEDDDKVVKGKYGVDWKLVSATLDFVFFLVFCGLSGCLSFFFLVPIAVSAS